MPLRSVRPSPGLVVSPGGRGANAGPDIATLSRVSIASLSQSAPVAGVDIGRFRNAITVASANMATAHPSALSTPGQDAGGGGGSSVPGPMAAQPAGVAPTPASPVASSSAPNVAFSPADASPKIRPMTLSATKGVTQSTSSNVTTADFTSMSGSDPGSGSPSDPGSGSCSCSTSTSTSEDVHAFISGGGPTGPGGRDGSSPPAAVVQGMRWSGGIYLSGDNPGNYDIVKYKWTFPTGAMKGYGAFSTALERQGDPASQYEVFSGQPTGAVGTAVKAVGLDGFTDDDLEYVSTEQGDHVINTFYWGPEASGVESVSATVTVKNRLTGATQDLTDKVNLNVIKPDGQITVQKKGTPGVSDGLSNQHPDVQALQIDKNEGEIDPQDGRRLLGIQYTANVKDPVNPTDPMNPTGFGGSFFVTQTIKYSSTRTTADSNNVAHKLEDGVLADGTYPDPKFTLDEQYAGAYVRDPSGKPVDRLDDNKFPNIGVVGDQSLLGGNDSPSTPLRGSPTTNFYTRDDSYVTTLMYWPETQNYASLDSIAVPVSSLQWSWSAKASYDTNQVKWVDFGPPTKDIPDGSSPTKDYPLYTHTFNEVRDNWVDRGPTSPPVPPK